MCKHLATRTLKTLAETSVLRQCDLGLKEAYNNLLDYVQTHPSICQCDYCFTFIRVVKEMVSRGLIKKQ